MFGGDRHFFLVLTGEVRLELLALFGVVSLMHVEDELARVDSLDKALQFPVVRVRGVRYLEVEGQVLVIFVVPASQNDENCGLFAIALVDTIQNTEMLIINEKRG